MQAGGLRKRLVPREGGQGNRVLKAEPPQVFRKKQMTVDG